MTDSERVMEVIRVKGLTNVQFCNMTGVSAATLSHIASGRNNPTLAILRSIINGFPDLNPLWVYSGTGDMFLEAGQNDNTDSSDGELPSSGADAADRSSDKDGQQSAVTVPQGSVQRTSRPTVPNSVPDLFEGLDGLSNGGKSGVAPQETGISLSDVVRETIIQVQPQPRRPRQITEIRIFFDDGTYESFGGPK